MSFTIISGYLQDQTGVAWAGARIKIVQKRTSSQAFSGMTVEYVTGAGGEYAFSIADGHYSVYISYEDNARVSSVGDMIIEVGSEQGTLNDYVQFAEPWLANPTVYSEIKKSAEVVRTLSAGVSDQSGAAVAARERAEEIALTVQASTDINQQRTEQAIQAANQAAIDGALASEAKSASQLYAELAKAAAETGKFFKTVPEGLAATQSDDFFVTPVSTNPADGVVYWLNDNGAAKSVSQTAGQYAVQQLTDRVTAFGTSVIDAEAVKTAKGETIIGGVTDENGASTLYSVDNGAVYLNALRVGNERVSSEPGLVKAHTDDSEEAIAWQKFYDDGWVENCWSEFPEAQYVPRALSTTAPYSASSGNSFDPDSLAIRAITLAPLNTLNDTLSSWSDAALFNNDSARGRAASDWMLRAARFKSMTETASAAVGQGDYERHWRAVNIALSYSKLDKVMPLGWRPAIVRWLNLFGDAISTRMELYGNNNHKTWAACALLAIWNATGKQEFYDKAATQFVTDLGHINANGTINVELLRGSKALHYHHFSFGPLVMMCEIAQQHGSDWYSLNEGSIHRLAEVVIHGINDPAWFASRNGLVAQDITELGHGWGGMPFYVRRFPANVADRMPLTAEKYIDTWLGGDCNQLSELWVK
ncbi:alginate lyase family protein [Winslowiella arboricola]|uniref:alginate lyase family protein n=1 Tax=Winslowiella arboricola TaxID=2978220 RepID=UPI00225E5744|nr:alginate lyase family protein [Winslowiella arboricola]MCU5775216.1 alginate lyase family protein [Winslowiella arboricola]